MGRKGVLLMNVGTPDEPTVGSVRTYLREFLLDPDVIDIPAPLRHLLVRGIILRTRPRKIAPLPENLDGGRVPAQGVFQTRGRKPAGLESGHRR